MRSALGVPHNRFTDPVLGPILRRRWRQQLVEAVHSIQPDLLLVTKGNWVDEQSIHEAKRFSRVTANYYPDGPFHAPNWNPELERAIRAYDVFFTFSPSFIPRLVSIGARPACLPFAWDPEMHPPIDLDRQPECEVSFVGNWSPERELWLRQLAGFNLEIWGHWHHLPKSSPLRAFVKGPAQMEADMSRTLARSAISLNLIQVFANGHNMRSFEAAAMGAFVLSRRTPELIELFVEGQEIECFESPGELVAKVRRFLADPAARHRIAEAARNRCATETYRRRCEQILARCFP